MHICKKNTVWCDIPYDTRYQSHFQRPRSSHDSESGTIRKLWVQQWQLRLNKYFEIYLNLRSQLMIRILLHAINIMCRSHVTQRFSESNPPDAGFKYTRRAHFYPLKCRITHRRHLIVLRKDSMCCMSASQKGCGIFQPTVVVEGS